jgi:hypothetical protein
MRAVVEKHALAVPAEVAVDTDDKEAKDVAVNKEGDGKALGRKDKDCAAE